MCFAPLLAVLTSAAQPFLSPDFLARRPALPGDTHHTNDPWNSDPAIKAALERCPVERSVHADLRGHGRPLVVELRRCEQLVGVVARRANCSQAFRRHELAPGIGVSQCVERLDDGTLSRTREPLDLDSAVYPDLTGGVFVVRDGERRLAAVGFAFSDSIDIEKIIRVRDRDVVLLTHREGGNAPAKYGVLGWSGRNDACLEPRRGQVDADLEPDSKRGVLKLLRARWTP